MDGDHSTLFKGIFPGTLWCGFGNIADDIYHRLGKVIWSLFYQGNPVLFTKWPIYEDYVSLMTCRGIGFLCTGAVLVTFATYHDVYFIH